MLLERLPPAALQRRQLQEDLEARRDRIGWGVIDTGFDLVRQGNCGGAGVERLDQGLLRGGKLLRRSGLLKRIGR